MKLYITFLVVLSLFMVLPINAQDTDCPCCTADHVAFDFWIGEWEVTNPDGTPAGVNTITRLEDGCVIREQWISATPGYTGTSYNFYNSRSKQWEQLWIDNQGAHLSLKGNLVVGSMVLSSKPTLNSGGVMVINRISWTPNSDGSVRQHWQISQDNGKTWTTAFDGLYRKKMK